MFRSEPKSPAVVTRGRKDVGLISITRGKNERAVALRVDRQHVRHLGRPVRVEDDDAPQRNAPRTLLVRASN